MEVAISKCQRLNFGKEAAYIIKALESCLFVAFDFEFSGIGQHLSALVSLEEKYNFYSKVAQSRSVISIGLSCFFWDPDTKSFTHKTWDLLTLPREPFVVVPEAGSFLVNHGFDFNSLFSDGILYTRSHPDKAEKGPSRDSELQQLVDVLLKSKKPIVLHNGFLDLLFFYQTFYAPLPPKVSTFQADLTEVFLGGLYDTKFVGAKHFSSNGLYLEYLFWNCYYSWKDGKHKFFSSSNSCRDDAVWKVQSKTVDLSLPRSDACEMYSRYGQCKKETCEDSHDVQLIVQLDRKGNQSRKRKKVGTDLTPSVDENSEKTELDGSVNDSTQNPARIPTNSESEHHRAGRDAFMTGFIFAHFLYRTFKGEIRSYFSESSLVADYRNKVFLRKSRHSVHTSDSCQPFWIFKSAFAKTSDAHKAKFEALHRTDTQ